MGLKRGVCVWYSTPTFVPFNPFVQLGWSLSYTLNEISFVLYCIVYLYQEGWLLYFGGPARVA